MRNQRRLWATQLGTVIRTQDRTARWVAQQAGLSESYLSRIITGVFPLGEERAQTIADLLGVPLFLVFEVTDVSRNDASKEQVAA